MRLSKACCLRLCWILLALLLQERASASFFKGTLARRIGLAEHKPPPHLAGPPAAPATSSATSSASSLASSALHSSLGRAGRHHSNTSEAAQPWMQTSHNRTLFFQPLAGLGNRLRALSSAVTVAGEMGVGLQVVWQPEWPCSDGCPDDAPFVAGWPDLFSDPPLRLADTFPGWTPNWDSEGSGLNRTRVWRDQPPTGPPANCTVHHLNTYNDLAAALTSGWQRVGREEVVCVKSSAWLTRHGDGDAAWFFHLLQPSDRVQQQVQQFQASVNWEASQWVCMHIRRTDLKIYQEQKADRASDVIPLEWYKAQLYRLMDMAQGDIVTRVLLATDDPSAEAELKSAFVDGVVVSYPKGSGGRGTVEGGQEALIDLKLLASCPILVGTFYSSYSETAKLLSGAYYMSVGNELRKTARMGSVDTWGKET